MLIVWVAWPREHEPVYQGRKLSRWLRIYVANSLPGDEQKRADAKEAIRQIGTNALPCLVHWLAYEPPRWNTPAMRLAQRGKLRWLFRKPLDQQTGPRFYGQIGFEILGPGAGAAVPDLKRIALRRGTRYEQSRQLAIEALRDIGADGLPALVEVLEQGDATDRGIARDYVLMLNWVGVDVTAAVPGLLLADRQLRQQALRLNPDPGIFVSSLQYDTPSLVSALTNCLWHSNATVRLEATHYLGWLSEKARSAEPALSHAFEDPDPNVRDAATNAVYRIVQGYP